MEVPLTAQTLTTSLSESQPFRAIMRIIQERDDVIKVLRGHEPAARALGMWALYLSPPRRRTRQGGQRRGRADRLRPRPLRPDRDGALGSRELSDALDRPAAMSARRTASTRARTRRSSTTSLGGFK